MTAAIELSADGFLQQINEYECIRDLGVGATAEVSYALGILGFRARALLSPTLGASAA